MYTPGGRLLGRYQLCSWPTKSLHHEEQTGPESAAAVSGDWEGHDPQGRHKTDREQPGKRKVENTKPFESPENRKDVTYNYPGKELH